MHPDFEHSTHHEAWNGLDRRAPPPPYMPPPSPKPGEPVTQEYLDHALQEWRHASRDYFNTHFIRLEELIRAGFPDGDPVKHCEVHQGYITKAKNRSDLWQAVLKQVLTGTVWAGVLAVSAALWVAFKAEVRK